MSDLTLENIEKQADAVSKTEFQEHINGVYAGLWGLIDDAKAQAEQSGKPLLIAISESHSSGQSSMIEMMVIDIISNLEIESAFAIEMGPDVMTLALESSIPSDELKDRIDSKMLQTLKYLNYDIISTEHPDIFKMYEEGGRDAVMTGEGLEKREEHMVKTILSTDGSVIHVGGTVHLAAITGDDDVQSKFEILTLNTGVLNEADLESLKSISPKASKQLKHSYNPDITTQVITIGDNGLFPEQPTELDKVADEVITFATTASSNFAERTADKIDQEWLSEQKQALLQRSQDLGQERFTKLEKALSQPKSQVSTTELVTPIELSR